jgi:hypothetical protein
MMDIVWGNNETLRLDICNTAWHSLFGVDDCHIRICFEEIMNWFMFATGVLQLAAGIVELTRGNMTLAGVYLCYGISAGLLATIK